MAILNATTLDYVMARSYNREDYIAPHERALARFWSKVQEFKDGGKITGTGRHFVVKTGSSHSNGFVAESGDLPTFVAPIGLQCEVDNTQYAASVAWSEYALSVVTGEGNLGKDVIDDAVKATTVDLGTFLNRASLGASTARIAVVEATTDTLTTAVCRNPEHVVQLRVNMPIDFVDSSGVKQGATETISAINFETRTITFGNARTLTAGWGIVQAGNTLLGMSGLRGTVDDGTYQATIYGKTKSSDVAIKGQVLDPGLQSYSEKLVRKAINRIKFQTGLAPDAMWCNQGVLSAHLNHLTGSRVLTVSPGEGVPDYKIGQKDSKLGFQNDGKFIPFEVDNDLPARELFIITTSLFRKHIARPANWVGDNSRENGQSSPFLFQATASSGAGYALAKYAGMYGIGNMAHLQPKANVAVRNIADEELAGD